MDQLHRVARPACVSCSVSASPGLLPSTSSLTRYKGTTFFWNCQIFWALFSLFFQLFFRLIISSVLPLFNTVPSPGNNPRLSCNKAGLFLGRRGVFSGQGSTGTDGALYSWKSDARRFLRRQTAGEGLGIVFIGLSVLSFYWVFESLEILNNTLRMYQLAYIFWVFASFSQKKKFLEKNIIKVFAVFQSKTQRNARKSPLGAGFHASEGYSKTQKKLKKTQKVAACKHYIQTRVTIPSSLRYLKFCRFQY